MCNVSVVFLRHSVVPADRTALRIVSYGACCVGTLADVITCDVFNGIEDQEGNGSNLVRYALPYSTHLIEREGERGVESYDH